MSARLISFSGIDCAGKSTQISRLATLLTTQNEKAQVLWFRPGYSPELDLARKWIRRLLPGQLPQPGPSERRQQSFQKPHVQLAWLLMAELDLLAQYACKVRLSLQRGYTVICDRYIPDANIDLCLRFPTWQHEIESALKLTSLLCPTPAHSFLLMLPEEEMLRRMLQKKEPFPDTEELRSLRYQRYRELAKKPHITVINAEQTIEQVHQAILLHL